MLTLMRRREECIVLHTSDGDITIKVTEVVRGYGVRLGISAPQSVNIVRGELEELATVARRVLA